MESLSFARQVTSSLAKGCMKQVTLTRVKVEVTKVKVASQGQISYVKVTGLRSQEVRHAGVFMLLHVIML